MSRISRFALASICALTLFKFGSLASQAASGASEPASAPAVADSQTVSEDRPTANRALLAPASSQRKEADTGLSEELLVDLAAERRSLEKQRVALEARAADLALVEENLQRQLSDLTTLRDEVNALLERSQAGHQQDVTQLVKMYRAMKPSQAGLIMGDIDLEVATLVIAEMDEKAAGPILANMDKTRAQTISKIIYERLKLPGDQKPIVVPFGNPQR
ncbi:MotE family protein [Paracoccus ravus]|uniref:MotE family protein n=1 Tax=Paracoccus ravus TaxID=2447760 RepID=UPI00106E7715|nr:hypothetical protein [Paracoccus ravus]